MADYRPPGAEALRGRVERTAIPAWIDGCLVAVDKMRVHRAGLRHKAVSVFVMRGDELLLQKRAAGKYHTPGLWTNTCCTHPHWGEDARDCAMRRLREELGISGLDLLQRDGVEYQARVGNGMTEHEVVDIFVAEAGPHLAIRPDPAEVADVRWTTLAELRREVAARPDDFTPWLRIYLELHSGAIFGATA